MSRQGIVMTWPLALLLLSLTPLGTAMAFVAFAQVHKRLVEQATLEALVTSLPTGLTVLDAKGRVFHKSNSEISRAVAASPCDGRRPAAN